MKRAVRRLSRSRMTPDDAFTLRYLGGALHSDWQIGSPILWQSDFEPGSPMLEAVADRTPHSGRGPEVLAGLKTLLESGTALDTDTPADAAATAGSA
jgi:hypothetical protein